MRRILKVGIGIVVATGIGVALAPTFGATHHTGCDTPGTGIASPVAAGTLFFTTYAGPPNIHRVDFDYDGKKLTLGKPEDIGKGTPGADGIIFAPDGDLLVGGQRASVFKVDPKTGKYEEASTGGPVADHLSPDRSPNRIWAAGVPGALAEIPVKPFGNGTPRLLKGDDTAVDTIAFDACGNAYYTAGGTRGFGSFGHINLTSFTTKRIKTNVPAAHGGAYDPFTGDILIFGDGHITQFDPKSQKFVSDLKIDGVILDQGATDGVGHVFVCDNNGNLVFVDFSKTRLVGDKRNLVVKQFLAAALDDVAPLSGRGAEPVPPPRPGKSENVQPVSGRVLVRKPGTSQFVPLAALSQIPVGTEIDATKGRVRLTSAVGGGKTESAEFYEGRFVVTQPRGLTTLTLSGPLRPCPLCGRIRIVGKRRVKERHLWGTGKGHFRTKGKYASATVRGTTWLTQDRTDGTLVRVTSGSVDVFDVPLRRHFVVRAGARHFAAAHP